jgi:D-serine deaminase-like pyridoxal phosphate-dependent protein
MTEVTDPTGTLPQLEALRRLDHRLPTPSLVVHAGIARQNVKRYADLARRHGVKLRPHAKTHKSDVLAAWQRDAGCDGLTVGTFAEADYFLAAGHRDLFVACPPVGAARERALAELAQQAEITVCVDSIEAIAILDAVGRSIGQPMRYYWEVDTGFARYGTRPGRETVAAVLEAQRFRYCAFDGLMTFGGSAYLVSDVRDVPVVSRVEAEQTVETADLIRAAGVDVPEVSVGSTPSAAAAVAVRGVTELRVGTYIFNDATQVSLGSARLEDCAQTICATVMSTSPDGRIVIDAGSKALPKETMSKFTTGYGTVLEYPGLVIGRVSEEASVLTWAGSDHVDPPAVGDQLQVVSNHCCSATYLFSHFWLIGDGVSDRLPVNARTR